MVAPATGDPPDTRRSAGVTFPDAPSIHSDGHRNEVVPQDSTSGVSQ